MSDRRCSTWFQDFCLAYLARDSTQYAASPSRNPRCGRFWLPANCCALKPAWLFRLSLRKLKTDWLTSSCGPFMRESSTLYCPLYSRHRFDGILLTICLSHDSRTLWMKSANPMPRLCIFRHLEVNFLAKCVAGRYSSSWFRRLTSR